jgi:hypothetical protein
MYHAYGFAHSPGALAMRPSGQATSPNPGPTPTPQVVTATPTPIRTPAAVVIGAVCGVLSGAFWGAVGGVVWCALAKPSVPPLPPSPR